MTFTFTFEWWIESSTSSWRLVMLSISTSQKSEAVKVIQRRRFHLEHFASVVDLVCLGVFRWKRRRILARFPWDMVLVAAPDDSPCRCWSQSHRLRLQRLWSLRSSTSTREGHLVRYSQRPPSYSSSSSSSKGTLSLKCLYSVNFSLILFNLFFLSVDF